MLVTCSHASLMLHVAMPRACCMHTTFTIHAAMPHSCFMHTTCILHATLSHSCDIHATGHLEQTRTTELYVCTTHHTSSTDYSTVDRSAASRCSFVRGALHFGVKNSVMFVFVNNVVVTWNTPLVLSAVRFFSHCCSHQAHDCFPDVSSVMSTETETSVGLTSLLRPTA